MLKDINWHWNLHSQYKPLVLESCLHNKSSPAVISVGTWFPVALFDLTDKIKCNLTIENYYPVSFVMEEIKVGAYWKFDSKVLLIDLTEDNSKDLVTNSW